MHRLIRLALAAGVALALVAGTESARAVSWYSKSTSLTVKQDGRTQGAAYGNFYNFNGSHARNSTVRRDVRPGGDGIFVSTDFFMWRTVNGSTGYQPAGQKQTGRTTSGRWVREVEQRPLHSSGSRARGVIKVCKDRSWRPDPCSSRVIRSFGY